MIRTWFADFYKRLSVKKVVTLSALFVVCVVLDLEMSNGWFIGFSTLAMLICFSCLLLMPCLAVVSIFVPRIRRILKYPIWIFLFFVVELYSATFIGRWQEEQTKSELQKIISATENYRKKTGEYPTNLNELVPECIEFIPSTKVGVVRKRSFYYHKFLSTEGDIRYTIDFDVHGSLCTYNSKLREYHYD